MSFRTNGDEIRQNSPKIAEGSSESLPTMMMIHFIDCVLVTQQKNRPDLVAAQRTVLPSGMATV